MANTFDSGLICSVCCEVALVNICQVVAPLNNFWNECSGNPMAPLVPVAVPVATAGATAVQTNPANFEIGDTNLATKLITPEHLNVSFHITNTQAQQGYKLSQLAEVNARKLAAAIWGKVLPIITNNASAALGFLVANVVTKAIASLTPADIGTAYGLLKCQPKHLIIDPAGMAKLMYQSGGCCFPFGGAGAGAFGFASINEQSIWTGADANTYGFAFCPEAIIIVSGVPAVAPQCDGIIDSRSISLPGIGLTVQFNLWCSSATRSLWGSYDIVFGAGLGAACAGVLIKSA
jgi:hypothetical protein